jgi:hypothetical protein
VEDIKEATKIHGLASTSSTRSLEAQSLSIHSQHQIEAHLQASLNGRKPPILRGRSPATRGRLQSMARCLRASWHVQVRFRQTSRRGGLGESTRSPQETAEADTTKGKERALSPRKERQPGSWQAPLPQPFQISELITHFTFTGTWTVAFKFTHQQLYKQPHLRTLEQRMPTAPSHPNQRTKHCM